MSRQPKGLSAVPPSHRDGDSERRNDARRETNDREVMYFAYDRLGMPLLHADLMRFRKGPLRLQRLRTLVIQGLMAERAIHAPAGPQVRAASSDGADDVFADPVGE
ncbi:hypothetical protein [Piscinibacter sp.]|uniref:hypothetical protein n=1 Tax=Piscinibacter sp. TaxID=1903157 RepID=UPI00355AAE54